MEKLIIISVFFMFFFFFYNFLLISVSGQPESWFAGFRCDPTSSRGRHQIKMPPRPPSQESKFHFHPRFCSQTATPHLPHLRCISADPSPGFFCQEDAKYQSVPTAAVMAKHTSARGQGPIYPGGRADWGRTWAPVALHESAHTFTADWHFFSPLCDCQFAPTYSPPPPLLLNPT